jgi:hypothetical protein
MPSFTNGVYNIRNVGRGLMLNMKGNSTTEGNQIQGYTKDHTKAQQVHQENQECFEQTFLTYTRALREKMSECHKTR